MFHYPEQYRMSQYSRPLEAGPFLVPATRSQDPDLRVIASLSYGWEHVSVSTAKRCPTWDEMCRVKDLFWDDEDVVMQLHPAKSQYVNTHPYTLHLWRPIHQSIPLPDTILV